MRRNLQILLLCIGVLLSCLTACGTPDNKKTEESKDTPSQSSTEDVNDDSGERDKKTDDTNEEDSSNADSDKLNQNAIYNRSLDYEKAANAFAADEVVMTVNGQDITWQEYYRWLYYILSYIEDHNGAITDWSTPCELNREYTIADYAKFYAQATVAQYRVIEQMAEKNNITLTEEEEQAIWEAWDNYVEQYGSEEKLVAYLESIYTNKELYLFGQKMSYLYDDLFHARYGENGERCTDQEVAEFATANDYVRIQYLLLRTVDDDNMLLDEKEIQKKKTRIYELSEQITAAEDSVAKFEELYAEYNEDNVADNYPEGYTRSLSSLSRAEIREVLSTLPEGSISTPVETGYGYYILYRLPLDYDGIVEYDKKDGSAYTLRYIAATNLFSNDIAEVLAGAEITYSEAFESLDLSQLFASES